MTAKILQGGTVISFDDTSQHESIRVRPRSSVVIQHDRITRIIDDEEETYEAPKGAEIIDVRGKIVSPGFVNTHVHI